MGNGGVVDQAVCAEKVGSLEGRLFADYIPHAVPGTEASVIASHVPYPTVLCAEINQLGCRRVARYQSKSRFLPRLLGAGWYALQPSYRNRHAADRGPVERRGQVDLDIDRTVTKACDDPFIDYRVGIVQVPVDETLRRQLLLPRFVGIQPFPKPHPRAAEAFRSPRR